MKIKAMRLPALILVLGLIAAVAASLLAGIQKAPAIKEHDFDFSVTYRLEGETRTLEGLYRCSFTGFGGSTNPLGRYYCGTFLSNDSEEHPSAFTIAQKDGLELHIVLIFSDYYLMDDAEDGQHHYDPYLAAYDAEKVEYVDIDIAREFDAEIIGWELPEPIENTFSFAGFSKLHPDSMVAMLFVGVLVIVANILFVKKDPNIIYGRLDKVSEIVNYVNGFVVIPVVTLCGWAGYAFGMGPMWIYRVDLCVPAVMAFALAASISLRRKGFTRAGFYIQLIAPVLYELRTMVESIATWF